MNKIGTLDIIKAYLGNKELTANNAYMGEISLIKGSGPEPEPLDKDYFYLQPLSTGNYSISTGDEVWKQNNTFEFRLNNTNWRKFSSLEHQDTSVGFDVYMANNPDLVALALDINAYNTYVVGENCKVFIYSMMMGNTEATFLGTDENFAYYSGTPEDPMDFMWALSGGMEAVSERPSDRMFEWDGTDFEGTDTNISKYSSFSVVATIITETIPLTANDKLYLRNTGGSIHSGIINSIQNVNYNIGGILNTLTDYTDNTYTITTSYADGLFKGDTHLISAGDLELPATTLASLCYNLMFYGCTALTTAPTELPATTLANRCYYSMFLNCSSLTTAPELPATTLADYCYYNMFNGCTNLNYIKCLATDMHAQYCLRNWVNKVSSTGTFERIPTVRWESGINGIPTNWTITPNAQPNYFKFTSRNNNSVLKFYTYRGSSPDLKYSKDNGVTWTQWDYSDISVLSGELVWFKGNNPNGICESRQVFSSFGGVGDLDVSGDIMTLCDNGTNLGRTIGRSYAFALLFSGSESGEHFPGLKNASDLELTATTLSNYCYSGMFRRCSNLITAPELPATTLTTYCYLSMFYECTSLIEAPELPATTLTNGCYEFMFYNCTSINKITTYCAGNQSSSSAQSRFVNWLYNVPATGDFYNLGNATYSTGASGIPEGWTVHTSL